MLENHSFSGSPAEPLPVGKSRKRAAGSPLTLIALFVPGVLFVVGLFLLRDHPRLRWLQTIGDYPWELWAIAVCGCVATAAGVADWKYHRSGKTVVGRKEHQSELAALAVGGVPLFVLMAFASVMARPQTLLIPVISVALFTTILICYDEFVFHRKRCGRYETMLHRLLVFGNALAWLAWTHWCFVRERLDG